MNPPDTERFVGHKVRLSLFEGPLDLLLYLVRAHRYDICDIPIAQITNQFIDYIHLMREVEADIAGEFLVTAATLMQIKARMLLPKAQSHNEEAMDDDIDPRAGLVEQLLELQRLQGAADALKEKREEWTDIFRRPVLSSQLRLWGDEETLYLSPGEVSSFDLLSALQRVLQRLEAAPVALIERETFTLSQRLQTLAARIYNTPRGATFEWLCDDCTSRLEVVVTFLAVLELIKRGRLKLRQLTLFDEIYLERTAP